MSETDKDLPIEVEVQPDISEHVSDPKLRAVLAKYSQSTTTITISPIPDPEQFAGYEKVLPGSADRILSMAENKSAHKQKMEEKTLIAETGYKNLGQKFGFVLVLAGIIMGGICILAGHGILGTILGAAPIVSIASIFVIGKKSHK